MALTPDYELTSRLVIPRGIHETFAFFEDPRNLARITPPWLRFEIRDPRSVQMREGAEIDYTIRWMGLRMPWRTLIEQYDPPGKFVDTQLRGPYSMWRHTHAFEETAGGTLVLDRVAYRLPLGPLGRIAHAAMVSRQLRGIFRYRTTALAGILGGDPNAGEAPEIRRV